MDEQNKKIGLDVAKRRYPEHFSEGSDWALQNEVEEKRTTTTDPHELGKLNAIKRHGRVN